jgi:hypothetical protein
MKVGSKGRENESMETALAVYIRFGHPGSIIPGIGYILPHPKQISPEQKRHTHLPVRAWGLSKKVDTHPALFTLQQPSYPLEESMPNQPE